MSLPRTVLLVSILCWAAGSAHADVADLYQLRSAIGDLEGAVLSSDSGVSVAIDEDGVKGSVQWVRARLAHSFSATLSAPVDKDTGNADFVGLKGLNDSASLKLEYEYINWPTYDLYKLFEDSKKGSYAGGAALDATQFRRINQCLYYASLLAANRDALLRDENWIEELEDLHAAFSKLALPTAAEITDFFETFAAGGPPPASRTANEQKTDEKVRKLEETLDDGVCADLETYLLATSNRDGVAAGLFAAKAVARSKLANRRQVTFYGFNTTIGEEEEFEYLDPMALAMGATPEKVESDELPWSAGLRIGSMWLARKKQKNGDESLIFSVTAERGYDESDEVTLCNPVENLEEVTRIADCEDVALGVPAAIDSILYELEYRALWNKLGFAIRAFYQGSDDKLDQHGFEIPLFFVPNKDGDMQGGVRLGWNDVDKDATFSVFVGTKFDLF